MAKFQDPIYVIAHADDDIRDLIRRRANAKQEVDLELECLNPLLETSPEDTNNVASRVNISIKGYRIQDLERDGGGSRSGSSPDHLRTAPVKLEKVKGIKFSGELRDFATFKREFNEVIVPNQEISEVSLHLKQLIPKKCLYLIERFKFTQYSEMMVELEKKFGGSRRVFISVLRRRKR